MHMHARMGPQGLCCITAGFVQTSTESVNTFKSRVAALLAILASYLCSITDPQLKDVFTGSFFLTVHVGFSLLCDEVEELGSIVCGVDAPPSFCLFLSSDEI